ncbi:hypothetical protein Hsc_3522 [Herbaspirillum seropedicae]|nr:hypothetical protein Hsc_3522 [Herbaspirillum seropedicae]
MGAVADKPTIARLLRRVTFGVVPESFRESIVDNEYMDDGQMLEHALSKNDGLMLLDLAITKLLYGEPLPAKLSVWLALKLIEIKDATTADDINAKKLFGLTKLGAPANQYGPSRATGAQIMALLELRYRNHGKKASAWLDVARACGIKEIDSLKRSLRRNGFNLKENGFSGETDEMLRTVAGQDLLLMFQETKSGQ